MFVHQRRPCRSAADPPRLLLPALALALGLVLSMAPWQAVAQAQSNQEFPNRAVRIVVGSAAGGVSDAPARHLARQLEKLLKQPVIVDNRPGAGTSLAARAVSLSPPDGYVLFYGNPTIFGPSLMSKAINAETDLTSIASVDRSDLFLIASGKSGIDSIDKLTSIAARQSVRCGYQGAASMMTVALIAHHRHFKHECVPYKSSDQILQSLMADDIQIVAISASAYAPLIAKGQLRLVSSLSAQRSAAYPNVPTLPEQGVPITILARNGLWAPPGLPGPIAKQLADAVKAAVQSTELTTALKSLAMEVDYLDAAGQLSALRSMNETYRQGALLTGFKPN